MKTGETPGMYGLEIKHSKQFRASSPWEISLVTLIILIIIIIIITNA